MKKINSVMIVARKYTSTVLLRPSGPVGQTVTWVIGGTSTPRMLILLPS